MQQRKFSSLQAKILTVCFIVYFCAYIGRLNMSASLDSIMADLNIMETLGGTLQTVFAVVYACGQFVFGAIVDRIYPKRLILLGLAGSCICNLAFSFAGSITLLIVLWALNGAFQSMLWTPIVRYLAAHFEGERRKRASFTMSFTLALGHIAAWGAAEAMIRIFEWRYAFRLPALVLLTAGAIAAAFLPSIGPGGQKSNQNYRKPTKMQLNALLGTGLAFVLVCSMTNGFLRDGVITWGPTILLADDGMFTLIIPVINLIGIIIGATLVRLIKKNLRTVAGMMMGACTLPAVMLFLFPNAPLFVLAVFLGTLSAILYGSNTLFTVLIPMEYDKAGRVGLAAGLVDSLIYVGSALAGTLTGFIRETSGTWQYVYGIWALFAVVGAACAFLSVKGSKKL